MVALILLRAMRRLDSGLRKRDYVTLWLLIAGPMVAIGIQTPGIGEFALRWGWLGLAVPLAVVLVSTHVPSIRLRSVGLLVAWLVWAGISLLRSPDVEAGLWLVAAVATGAMAFLLGTITEPPSGSVVRYVGTGSLVLLLLALVARGYPRAVGNLNPDRILAMATVVPLVLSWKPPVSRLWVAATGLGAVGIGIMSGSRTASAVLLVLALSAPGLRLPRVGRLLAAGVVLVLLVGASGTNSFQERWFIGQQQATAGAQLSVDNLNTSGRREAWSAILSQCDSPVVGDGVGASSKYGSEYAQGFPEPHNEALRIWCDTGIVGSGLFWGFVTVVAWTAILKLRRSQMREAWPHIAALQLLVGVLLLSATDNPVTTAALFPAVGLLWGWSAGVSEGQFQSDR